MLYSCKLLQFYNLKIGFTENIIKIQNVHYNIEHTVKKNPQFFFIFYQLKKLCGRKINVKIFSVIFYIIFFYIS